MGEKDIQSYEIDFDVTKQRYVKFIGIVVNLFPDIVPRREFEELQKPTQAVHSLEPKVLPAPQKAFSLEDLQAAGGGLKDEENLFDISLRDLNEFSDREENAFSLRAPKKKPIKRQQLFDIDPPKLDMPTIATPRNNHDWI